MSDPIDVALRKSHAASQIADLLCQVSTGLSITQLPPYETRSHYHAMAESVVQIACGHDLDRAAEYYACDCACAMKDVAFSQLAVKDRYRMVQDFRTALNGWLRALRGEFRCLERHKFLAQQDRDEMKKAKEKRLPLGRLAMHLLKGKSS